MNGNDLNNSSRTDWSALAAMSDEDIDYSDIPPLSDEFFEQATLRIPANQAQYLILLEPDIKQWFDSKGEKPQVLINQVLRKYIAETSDS